MNFSDDRKWQPSTFWCDEVLNSLDFEAKEFLACCSNCHTTDNSKLIRVYPRSGDNSNLPDCGLGVSALVCCNLYDTVRGLPRSWWLGFYGVKHGYSREDIAILQAAADTKDWLKVQSSLGSKYFRINNPDAEHGRVRLPDSRNVGVSTRKVKAGSGKCPACGAKWSGDVCDNCGHGANI